MTFYQPRSYNNSRRPKCLTRNVLETQSLKSDENDITRIDNEQEIIIEKTLIFRSYVPAAQNSASNVQCAEKQSIADYMYFCP